MSITELLEDPSFPDTVEQLQRTLDAERVARERFYEEMSEEQKTEFINGKVIVHSPAKARHIQVTDNLNRLVRAYIETRDLGRVFVEKALCIFKRNDYEPDIVFFGPAKAALIEPVTMKFPVPDFVVEVLSESTATLDRGIKLRDYETHGVGEYWIIDAERETLEQYLPAQDAYELAMKSGSGEVVSTVVSGFRIPIRAIFDDTENLRVLRALLAEG